MWEGREGQKSRSVWGWGVRSVGKERVQSGVFQWPFWLGFICKQCKGISKKRPFPQYLRPREGVRCSQVPVGMKFTQCRAGFHCFPNASDEFELRDTLQTSKVWAAIFLPHLQEAAWFSTPAACPDGDGNAWFGGRNKAEWSQQRNQGFSWVTVMVTPSHLLTGSHIHREQQSAQFYEGAKHTSTKKWVQALKSGQRSWVFQLFCKNLGSFTYYCTDVSLNHELQFLKMKFYTSEFDEVSQLPLQMLCLGETLD